MLRKAVTPILGLGGGGSIRACYWASLSGAPGSNGHGTGRYPELYPLDGAENMLVAATAPGELAARP